MGTNFYMFTKEKSVAKKYAPDDYMLVDEPSFGYKFHVAKTSMGWLPLFQGHYNGINSVKKYKEAYDTNEIIIMDEYDREYTWNQFNERVLQFNGGIDGVNPKQKVENNKDSPFYDADCPEYIPISHFNYAGGRYASEFFKDDDGYEFDDREFS